MLNMIIIASNTPGVLGSNTFKIKMKKRVFAIANRPNGNQMPSN